MTKDEKIKYLREYLEFDACCPCCQETKECSDGCTFEDDDPYAFERMKFARDVLEKTK